VRRPAPFAVPAAPGAEEPAAARPALRRANSFGSSASIPLCDARSLRALSRFRSLSFERRQREPDADAPSAASAAPAALSEPGLHEQASLWLETGRPEGHISARRLQAHLPPAPSAVPSPPPPQPPPTRTSSPLPSLPAPQNLPAEQRLPEPRAFAPRPSRLDVGDLDPVYGSNVTDRDHASQGETTLREYDA